VGVAAAQIAESADDGDHERLAQGHSFQ
jgi:hypothetical protein